MSNIKLDRRKLILIIIFALILLLLSIGFSYSIYTGKIKIFNRTETTIKTKELGLIYTGVEEISAPNIIPGMEFEKTFTVENISDVPVDYNIYMENITNEFNEDLVYVITDEENNVVSENIIPKTNPKKSYLKTTINIDANTLQKYTMRVIYKYTDEDQSAYQGSTFKGTVGIDTEKNATDYNKYKVTIDPNGGVYENSSKNTVYQLETGEKIELKTPTKELNTFVGWEASVNGVLDGNIITVKDSDITVTAKWNLSEEAVARINDKYYASIQNAINDSIENDKIYLLKNTEESPLNDKNVILDLNGYKVTGTFTNNNKLDVINGTIENNNGKAIINNGELTLGENDDDISTDSIKVIGKSVAIEQNGTLNFYDGYIEGIVGVAGNYHEKPTGYSVFVDHNNDKDCQKIYLVKTPSNAVAITKENGGVYYYNLQDAINSNSKTKLTIYLVRDFEAAYTLTVAENQNAIIDIDGHNVTVGYTITNKGNLTIKDSNETKGILKPSVSIENENTLTLSGININETTDANVINNKSTLNIENTMITALGGYAVSNTGNAKINIDANSTLKANKYAMYTKTDEEIEVNNGNILGIYNEGNLLINGGESYTNGSNEYAIYSTNGILNLTAGLISSSKNGILSDKTLIVKDTKINTTGNGITIQGSNAKTTINGGIIKSQNGNGIYDSNGEVEINKGEIEGKVGIQVGGYGNGNTTINGGTIKGISSPGIQITNGWLKINGGEISSTEADGISSSWATHSITIINGTIKGKQNGITLESNRTTTELTVEGGKIVGETNYGIKSNGKTTIGKLDEEISIKNPEIKGNTYGLYISGGTVSFYDGVLKGKTAGYYGTINEYPDATLINSEEEEIENETYQINYLVKQENYCKVGETEYNSLQKAIDSIESEGTVEFIKTATGKTGIEIPSGKNITIDLKGNTYSTTQQITNNGELHIDDTSETKTGRIVGTEKLILINTNNKFELKNGILERINQANDYVVSINKGEAEINGGEVKSIGNGILNSATLIVKDTKINTTGNGITIQGSNAKTTINGGIIKSQNGNGIYDSNGEVEINKGEIEGKVGIQVGGYGNGNTTINGGTIKGISSPGIQITNGWLKINGGEISSTEADGISSSWATHSITIINGTIKGKQNGITLESNRTTTELTVEGGKIVGETNYGIKSNGKTTIGKLDEEISIKNPEIKGNTYGLYISGGTVNFYDGILKGQTASYYGSLKNVADGYAEEFGEEIVDGNTYITDILVKETEAVINETTNTKYIKLSDAINNASENDTLKLLKNVSVYYDINNSGNITLDLNGYSINTSYGIKNTGTLNIVDSSDSKFGKIYSLQALELFNNTGTLNINDISLENVSTEKNIILNDGTGVTTLNNVNINTLQGIKNNTNATLNINNSTITATKTAINNIGTLNIDGGNYTGNEYSLYSSSQKEENIKNCNLNSNSNSYNKNNNGTATLKNTNVNSNFINNNAQSEINYISGTINGLITNTGTISLESVEQSYTPTSYNTNLITNNGVKLTIKNSKIKMSKENTNNFIMTTIYNNKGTLIIDNSDIILNDTSSLNTHYGIRNLGTGILEMNSGNIEVTGGNIAYGIYNETANNATTVTGGTINVHDTNTAYGIYVNLGTVTLGDNDGLVSTTNPIIKSSGSTTGIGVKKVNGYFKYYDGKLMGSTDPKPDTTTESATDYEVNNYYDNVTGMNYCILQKIDEDYSDAVAQVGKKKYNSLQLAFDGATDGATIVLLKNYAGDITNSRKIIFDLNSKTLTGQVINNGEMTLHNGTITNDEKTPVVNNKTLTIGTTDATIDLEEVKIIGNDIGLEQNGSLNFYDGYVTGNLAIKGNANFTDKSFALKTETVDGKQKAYPIIRNSMSENETLDFEYLGKEETFTIVTAGIYKLETWGAQGGSYDETYHGGYGGYSSGLVNLEKGTMLYVNVGSQGEGACSNCKASYNGGGQGYGKGSNIASTGGGATHIATKSGLLSSLENFKDDILIVSGAGAGGYYHSYGTNYSSYGGNGGGFNGTLGKKNSYQIAQAGSQTSGGSAGYRGTAGSFGKGGTYQNNTDGASGGGAGLYGGGGAAHSGSGGGSGYIGNSSLTNKVMYCYECEESNEEATKTVSTTNVSEEAITNYAKKGNGYARITFIGSN